MPTPLTLSKSRIEALSDGIFAIAMTLLVLKLEVPMVMHHSSNADMLDELLGLAPAFATFVVTFLIAGGFWYLHHLTFHFIRHVNGILLWLNLVLLMFVSLLPFSAGLMSHFLVHPVSQVFYFGNQCAIALLLNLHWQYARRRGLLTADPEHAEISHLTYRIGTAAAAFAAAVAIALVYPAGSPIAMALAMLCGVLAERRKSRAITGLKRKNASPLSGG